MIKQITRETHKCVDGDSSYQTSTGIQRHRLRALFERDKNGNTAGADELNICRTVLKTECGSRFVRERTLRVREGR
ncbi:MAG: hypothetical protein PUJ08_11090 [Lachnospiraceae bacterium]|nr:hypothetical protein [Lachnospiraceae bacterium]